METAEKNVKDPQGQKLSPTNTAVHIVTHKLKQMEHKTGIGNPFHWCGGKHPLQQCHFKTSVCHKHGYLARIYHTKNLVDTMVRGKEPKHNAHTCLWVATGSRKCLPLLVV